MRPTMVIERRWGWASGLACVLLLSLALVLTACGGDSGESGAAAQGESEPTAGTADGTAADGSSTTPATAPSASSAAADATLRIASGFLPATLDPGVDGYSLIQFGIAETLTRVGPTQEIEPWLAETVESDDGQTWRVTLREGATFWNGAPIDAAAVAASLRHSLETIPSAAQYLDPEVKISIVDERALDLTFAEPSPALPNNLATFHLLIALEDADALGGHVMTGLYQPVVHTPDDQMQLAAHTGHWSGVPPFGEVSVRLVRDANARMLGLQSGEIDLVTEVPPELTVGVGAGIEVVSGPSTRVHHIILNHTRAPFNDPAVRDAFALAIDRNLLNELTLAGLGTPVSSIFPPGVGLPTVPELETDLARAAELLDAAGWIVGSDGVRERDGQQLTFTLHTYARRPELPTIAVSIQDQLRSIGFKIEIQQVDDIVAQLETGEFEAGMFSANLVPIGDPRYAFNVTLVDGAIYNYGGFQHARLDAIVAELLTEGDAAAREALIIEAQEIVRVETAAVYLVAAPRILAYQTDALAPFEVHPNDLYMIDASLRPGA